MASTVSARKRIRQNESHRARNRWRKTQLRTAIKDVREKMADLARMEAMLSELVCACHARKGNVSCPLIASLQDGTKLAASARGSHGVTTP
mgnify:CR=1 FL=1